MGWTIARFVTACALVSACTPRTAASPANVAVAGISIALYDGGGTSAYGVVDDRRWVEITGGTLVLDNIEPGAALASLVLEPLSEISEVHLGACRRDRIEDALAALGAGAPAGANPKDNVVRSAPPVEVPGPWLAIQPGPRRSDPGELDGPVVHYGPVVRCDVVAKPGRYLVRLLYISSSLGYRAQHDVEMTSTDRATVTSRFAIATPGWGERAELTLFDGLPGGMHPPRELARGQVMLDGSTAILTVAPATIEAQLRRVFDGAVLSPDVAATEPMWARDSVHDVWVWLELSKLPLAPGPLRVHVDLPTEGIRDIVVPAAGRRQAPISTGSGLIAGAMLRLPLWIDPGLRGKRERFADLAAGSGLAERFLISVSNLGDVPREVWVEEHLRPSRTRTIERASQGRPVEAGDLVRSKLVVDPGQIQRTSYTVAYDL